MVVVTFGITSRVAMPAIDEARRRGIKVGHLRMLIVWPFPADRIRELAGKVKAFVVPELNMGQMVLEVQRIVEGRIGKFYEQICLLEQKFVKDEELTIQALIAKAVVKVSPFVAERMRRSPCAVAT